MNRIPKIAILFLVLLAVGACSVNPQTGEREFNRTLVGSTIGGAAGGLLGAVVGGERGALIGIAAGAALGGGTAYWMEKRSGALAAKLERDGMEVRSGYDQSTGQPVLRIQAPADIAFTVGSAELQPQVFGGLSTIADLLVERPELKVEITGHTDSTGGHRFYQLLSRQRALTVAQFLYASGVPAVSVATRGAGASEPTADNDTAAGRAKNRRVEIRISGT